MELLFSFHHNLLKNVNDQFFRFLYKNIDWNQRMIAITGPRGSGKTTLMLQYIKYGPQNPTEALYVTADHPYFYNQSLFAFADEFQKNNGRFLFIDEVHKYPKWSSELKNIYDGFPELKIVISASSALELYRGEADLSRRLLSYTLPGMSFREYLLFSGYHFQTSFSIDDILKNHLQLTKQITNEFHPLPLFQQYLRTGYLPISSESDTEIYYMKLSQIINTIIDSDLSYTENYTRGAALKVKKLLGIVAESVPFKPNIASLARKLDISRDSVYAYLNHLEKARLLNFLDSPNKGISLLQKPEKLFLENTNLSFALKRNPDIGNMRETFLLSQLVNNKLSVYYPGQGDFQLDDFIIEVGGKAKTNEHKEANLPIFIAADGIETGFANKIPLWLFGFLY